MDSLQVAVVGAGIIGLTSATALQEQFPSLSITIIAEKFSPHTTGDGSAGLWEPYLTGATDIQLVRKWSLATYYKFLKLWRSNGGPSVGLSMFPIKCLYNKKIEDDAKVLHKGILGYKELDEEQLTRLRKEHGNSYRSGYEFITLACEPRKYLPHLLNEFVKKGGIVKQRRVESLQELATEGFSVVVNCTGLQAEQLVGDSEVFPIRGQIVMVQAPWQHESIIYQSDESNFYIIPNQDWVVLGGTSQKNDRNTQVNTSDTKQILEGCYKIEPRLQNAKILKEWVGLRPGRTSVRLGLGEPIQNHSGCTTSVIHNYGHGGSGVTLSWGCALEVAAILQNVSLQHLHSKI